MSTIDRVNFMPRHSARPTSIPSRTPPGGRSEGSWSAPDDPRAAAAQLEGDASQSGSKSGEFTLTLVNQMCHGLWTGRDPDPRMVSVTYEAAIAAVEEIQPRNPIEGMLAAQMVVTHGAAMECFRRAHLPEQTFEGRQVALTQANKLVRSYTALVETLDKHRGKGQQVVRVEHVHVHPGGQAIVGTVGHAGRGGSGGEAVGRPHAPASTGGGCGLPLRSEDTERQPVPAAGGPR
jgi:hypothetical protein